MLSYLTRAAIGRALPRTAASSAASRITYLTVVTPSTVQRLGPIAVRGFVASAFRRSPAAAASKPKSKPKTKTKTKPKTAAKKKPAKKAPSKKTTKKKVLRRPVVNKRKKKVLTSEQKDRIELTALRKMALRSPPRGKPNNAWLVYMVENLGPSNGEPSVNKTPVLGAQFKALSEEERERYGERGRANLVSNKKAYKQWIESHPVEVIFAANQARRRMIRKHKQKITLFKDERQPVGPLAPYAAFTKAHYHDYPGEPSVVIFRALSQRWRDLTEAQRQPYLQQYRTAHDKWSQTVEDLHSKAKSYWAAKGVTMK